MSDWENDDEPQQVAPPPKLSAAGRKKFDDEDVEEEVKDDWEEEDSEPEKPKEPVALPPRKKKSVKQKIAEKEEEERLRREQGLDDDEEEEDWDADPIAKRRMEREAQLKSDVENAANLLGTAKIADDGLSKLKSMNPSSKEDWESFADLIYAELIKKQSSKPGFEKHFVSHMYKNIASTLRDVDIRKSSTMLKAYAEDKAKAEKEAKKSGGQKKVAVAKPKAVGTASAKNVIDTRAYGDEALDDDLDFM
ncbi:hypothetical protein PANT_3c00005 [Moesziomyces antarcticus T-34]|uniref:Eukaryotic translation initiation factor 3 subunit J n=1 Tax=Pseudozyma antarctica (strain T-34) TaxID=1151754 RepID=M9LWZ4_PSEA3|nr:hypothetical protein PANT_3c00005 [Moesziomyces antarcticus T-34]